MTEPRPRTLILYAAVLGLGSLVLGEQALVASSRLRVPPFVGVLAATVGLAGAIMIILQAARSTRWNDLLASILLLAATGETLWFAVGRGPRPCRVGMWLAPEPVCRAGIGVGTIALAAATSWAAIRAWRSRGGSAMGG